MIATIGKIIALAALTVFLVFVGAWVASLISVVVVTLGIAWLCNARFAVTEKGVLVGYYKRSTGFVPIKC